MCGCVHPYTFAYKHNHLAGGTVIGHSKQGANKVILGHRNIKVEPKGGEKPNLFGIQTQVTCLSINLPNIHYLRVRTLKIQGVYQLYQVFLKPRV